MSTLPTLAEKHNLISETKFQVKSFLLIVRRLGQNAFANTRRFKDRGELSSLPIISVSESELWTPDDNEQNWILTAGKIQNLRLAARRLNGIEVQGNRTFSFWAHLGNPNLGRGYVVGREIREGCIVPTIAGGLCQLSNALYDAALKANFEIVERHRHSKVIKGSLAEQDRDATVKWNYVDLRFRSSHPFRIEIDLTTDKLIVKFRSTETQHAPITGSKSTLLQSSKLNDCYSCGNFECFKHPERTSVKSGGAITTFILDDKWSEYDKYIKTVSTEQDFFIVPLFKNKFIKTTRYEWTIRNQRNVRTTSWPAIRRALQLRLAPIFKLNLFSLLLNHDRRIARAASKLIPIESTHLVISQNLVPFLWEQGALGGRTYDVLMSRLPIEKLHQRLDAAHLKYPESETLNDFRAPQTLIDLENLALTKSRHIVTPHKEIADTFNNKSIKLDWVLPPVARQPTRGDKILFPGPGLGRKGAYEMRRLAGELNLPLVLTGEVSEANKFWDRVVTEFSGNNPLDNIQLVVYPTYVEHQPRILLKALAAGIPVITTTASGLSPTQNLTIIPIGDYDALKHAVVQQIEKRSEAQVSKTLV